MGTQLNDLEENAVGKRPKKMLSFSTLSTDVTVKIQIYVVLHNSHVTEYQYVGKLFKQHQRSTTIHMMKCDLHYLKTYISSLKYHTFLPGH